MSKMFGFDPDQIRNLTLQEFGYYYDCISIEEIPSIDIALENIKNILVAGFGIKIKGKSTKDPVDQARDVGVPAFTFTTEEKDAWIKAGTPNIGKFLKEYRNGN